MLVLAPVPRVVYPSSASDGRNSVSQRACAPFRTNGSYGPNDTGLPSGANHAPTPEDVVSGGDLSGSTCVVSLFVVSLFQLNFDMFTVLLHMVDIEI